MNYLHGLITDHIRTLSGVEFKIAAYAYSRLESRGRVTFKIRECAEATGVSWRQAQSALKSLRQKGILKVHSVRGRDTCCRLPDAVKAKVLDLEKNPRGPLRPAAATPSTSYMANRQSDLYEKLRAQKDKHLRKSP